MLDGFEDLSAENQAKIKEAILKGDIAEADKTDVSDLAYWGCIYYSSLMLSLSSTRFLMERPAR